MLTLFVCYTHALHKEGGREIKLQAFADGKRMSYIYMYTYMPTLSVSLKIEKNMTIRLYLMSQTVGDRFNHIILVSSIKINVQIGLWGGAY